MCVEKVAKVCVGAVSAGDCRSAGLSHLFRVSEILHSNTLTVSDCLPTKIYLSFWFLNNNNDLNGFLKQSTKQ